MMDREELLDWLKQREACGSALTWIASQTDAAPSELWDRCERGDWLLWVAARAGVDRRAIVSAACDCAEPALVHVPAGDDRPRLAIEAARAWAADPSEERAHASAAAAAAADSADAYARAATAAAYAAAAYADSAADAHSYAAAYYAADAAAAAYAAYYAAAAYTAARDAAYAASAASDAEAASYYAAAHAAAATSDARPRSLAESARLVRARISWQMIEVAIAGGAR